MARGKKKANRRKKSSGSRPLLFLLGVVLLIALAFFLLEKLRGKEQIKPVEQPAVSERHKLPPRNGDYVTELQPYTSAAAAPVKQPRKKKQVGPGTVAIVIDDMGTSLSEVNELMAINVPLTFSIIPDLAKDREVAEAAHRKGYQVMIHVPMQPKGYPRQRLEKNGLLLTQDDAEIGRRIRGFLKEIPYVVGANNHMGSSFTENEGKMRAALSVLQEKKIFFIDSRTSPSSVGYSLAHEMGMEAATRNVFLDNVQDVGAITKQLDELAALARKRGNAIGICHPHRATIQALAAALPAMKKEGITFVYASELVR